MLECTETYLKITSACISYHRTSFCAYFRLKRFCHIGNYCRLVLGSIVKRTGGNCRKARRTSRQLSWKSLREASDKDINRIIKHCKTTGSKKNKPTTETAKKVL